MSFKYEKWVGYEFATSAEYSDFSCVFSGVLLDIKRINKKPIYTILARDISGNDAFIFDYSGRDFKRFFYDATALPGRDY